MPVKLYLDDVRPCPEGWTLVQWPEEAVPYLEQEIVSDLSLDHDLGDDLRGTGYTLITWLEEAVLTRGLKAPDRIVIHSANPVGRSRMESAIKNIRRFASSTSRLP